MKNKIQDGKVLALYIVGGCASGDPVLVGGIKGVARETIAALGTGQVDLEGVFDLSVKGIDGSGNSAVAVGDKIYFVAGDTPKLSKKASGTFYGYALEAVDSGATSTIKVLLINGGSLVSPSAGAVASSHVVILAGKHTTAGGDATETITATGAVAGDIAIVSLISTSGTARTIIAAVAATDAITVTMSGDPSTGHVIGWMILRAVA